MQVVLSLSLKTMEMDLKDAASKDLAFAHYGFLVVLKWLSGIPVFATSTSLPNLPGGLGRNFSVRQTSGD